MKTRSNIFLLLIICMTVHPVFSSGIDNTRQKIQVWETPEELMAVQLKMAAYVDSTLPAPQLIQEPPYTWGSQNTLHWNSDSVRTFLQPLGMTLLFFEIQAYYNENELWGFVGSHVDSATFTNLPPGRTINYRLRYYTRNQSGEFGRSLWSEPVGSIQDVSIPVISGLNILDLNDSNGKIWSNSRTIQVQIEAHDPDSGQVMQVAFHEQNGSVDQMFRYDIDPPRTEIDLLIPYTLYVEEHEIITLTVWIIDVAGQPSTGISQTFFWWDMEEEMTCFPNPFYPRNGEISTINVGIPNVTEARIFDPFGNLVRTLNKQESDDFFEWDGRNGRGDYVAKGGYICVVSNNERVYCKIAVLR